MDRKNPFPGMNPYMELTWPDVHLRLIANILDALGMELPDDLVAKADLRIELSNGRESHAYPDLAVVEEFKHRWVEVRTEEGELDTVIEVLSPANKNQHRSKYIAERGDYVDAGVTTWWKSISQGVARERWMSKLSTATPNLVTWANTISFAPAGEPCREDGRFMLAHCGSACR